MFPIINHLDDLLPHIADRKEINVSTQSNGYHVVCYSISTPTTFNDPDPVKQSFLRECRGITFYPSGAIASRPFHKFWNVNERESTLLSNLDMSADNIVRIMDKRDGSMVHPVKVNGKIVLKTKKSFESDVAVAATEFLHRPENANILSMCYTWYSDCWTPIFEYTAPNNRIVLKYEETELKLLHIRNDETGEYWMPHGTKKGVKAEANAWNIKVCDEYPLDQLQTLVAGIQTAEQIEGYVIQFKNGDMVKWKTPWYCDRHRMVVFQRRRDIAEMVLNESIDDLKSAFVGDEDRLAKIADIESEIVLDILDIKDNVEEAVALSVGMEKKDIAMKYKGTEFFGLIMDIVNGKEPKYIEFYRKYYLKEKFSLEQI